MEETHNILSVVAHVFADQESQVATFDHLVVDDGSANRILGPLGIDGISNSIIISSKHGDRHLGDCLNRDQIRRALLE